MPYSGLTAYSSNQNDAFSFTGNTAALAAVKSAGLGIYGERKFLMNEDNSFGIAAVFPSSKGNFGLQINYSGFKNFNEQQAGAAYARSLGKKLDIGIQFNYYGYKIPAYYNVAAVNFEAGVILHLTEKFKAGIHLFNPTGGKLGKTDEKLAAVYKIGLGYDASDDFFVSMEIFKEEDQKTNVTGGFQYHFRQQFFIRAGFRSDSGSGFGGIGFLYRELRIDVSASVHPQLGVSLGILLLYNFKKR